MTGVTDFLLGTSYESKYDKLGKNLLTQKGLSQASLYKALAAIKAGYGNADAAITQQGSVATRAILDRERQMRAGNKQSALDRGIYSTSTYDAMNRGTAAATNNALADMNAQLAQLGVNTKISEGQAIAGAYGGLAQNASNYDQMLLSLGLNTEYGRQGGYLDDIIGIFGTFAGGWGGAAAGAVGGGGSKLPKKGAGGGSIF